MIKMTIVGTRPENMRFSRVMARLDETVDHGLLHTGLIYDCALNGIFFDELGIRQPDHFLDVATTSLRCLLGEILIKTEEVLLKEHPGAVLIVGDTNCSIACIIAKRMRSPIYHMEAGDRCFNANVPEETNLRLVDLQLSAARVLSDSGPSGKSRQSLHSRRSPCGTRSNVPRPSTKAVLSCPA